MFNIQTEKITVRAKNNFPSSVFLDFNNTRTPKNKEMATIGI
jgi:hypothetical protein